MSRASRITRRFGKQWLAMGEVVSVATQEDHCGREMIVIGVIDASSPTLREIPKQIQGVRIILEETGGIELAQW